MFIVTHIAECREDTQCCKLVLYWSCDHTVRTSVAFSLPSGLSSLAAKGGNLSSGVVLAASTSFKNLCWLIRIIGEAEKRHQGTITTCQLIFCVSEVFRRKKLCSVFVSRDYSSKLNQAILPFNSPQLNDQLTNGGCHHKFPSIIASNHLRATCLILFLNN